MTVEIGESASDSGCTLLFRFLVIPDTHQLSRRWVSGFTETSFDDKGLDDYPKIVTVIRSRFDRMYAKDV